MLKGLPKKSERVFGESSLRSLQGTYLKSRKRIAKKLNNPRLARITFRTLRHWKATKEYHRTKDILYVQKLLGHKNIQNTLIYIDLEKALFNSTNQDEFTVRAAANIGEACSLVEAGFEYVTGDYADGGKIFRKRK
jgi:integrase